MSVNQLSQQLLHVLEVGQLLQELLLRHIPASPVEAQVKVGLSRSLEEKVKVNKTFGKTLPVATACVEKVKTKNKKLGKTLARLV